MPLTDDNDDDYGWVVRLEDLYLHSVAHQSVRALQLSRQHQINDLGKSAPLRPAFNLAGLPREVFDMILDTARSIALTQARKSEPVIAPFCDCMLVDNIFRHKDALSEFQKWCQEKLGHRLDNPMDEHCIAKSRIRREFQATEYCEKLLDKVRESVAEGCKRCEDVWVNTWKTMAGLGTDRTATVQGLQCQEAIINMLDECNHVAFQLSPLQGDHIKAYEEDEDNGLDGLIDQLRNIFVVVVPKSSSHTTRHRRYFVPEPEDHIQVWPYQDCGEIEASYRRTPLHHLLKEHKECLIRITPHSDEEEGEVQRADVVLAKIQASEKTEVEGREWMTMDIEDFLEEYQWS